MQGCLGGGNTDDSMCAALSCAPAHFPRVQALCEADLSADAVGALRDGVSVEGELVVLLDEDVQRAVIRIPAVFQLGLA